MTRVYGKIGFHFIFNSSNIETILKTLDKYLKIEEVRRNNWSIDVSEKISEHEIKDNIVSLSDKEEIHIVYFASNGDNQKYLLTYTNEFIELYIGFWPLANFKFSCNEFIQYLFKSCLFCLYGFELEIDTNDKEELKKELISFNEYPFYIFDTKNKTKEYISISTVDKLKDKILIEKLKPFKECFKDYTTYNLLC